MNMTESEINEAVTNVLTQFGELVRYAQGDGDNKRKTIGAITIQFHDDGNYSHAYAGVFQKAATMGAIFDCLLNFRESLQTQEVSEGLTGLFEMLSLSDKDIN